MNTLTQIDLIEQQPSYETVDAHVQRIAALLPFPVALEADMGGTFVLQIDLGQRGGVDDPHDTAGIDPEDLHWWVDIEGGERTHISGFDLDANAAEIAAWIARTAYEERCPAALDDDIDMRGRNAIVASSHPPLTDQAVTATSAPYEACSVAAPRDDGDDSCG